MEGKTFWPGIPRFLFYLVVLMAFVILFAAYISFGQAESWGYPIFAVLLIIPAAGLYGSLRRYAVTDESIEVRNFLPLDRDRIMLSSIERAEIRQEGPNVEWPLCEYSISLWLKGRKEMKLDNFPEDMMKEFIAEVEKKAGKKITDK